MGASTMAGMTQRLAEAVDAAFWRLPLPVHFAWGGVEYILEAITGSANPSTFRNIRELRRQRLEVHRKQDN